jgi:tetratricopeptide (TPR) repeat protein
MKNNKTPVIIVAVVLLVLIIAPIVTLIVLKKGTGSDESSQNSERKEVVVDFELSQLAKKAKQLVNNDLAAALRRGDVPIDFMSTLRDDLKKADKELSSGKVDRARNGYMDIVSTAEARLKTLEFAESAGELKDSTYTELGDHEYLKTAFENTYDEAVYTYNQGLQDLEASEFEKSVRHFEATQKILNELRAQSVQQVEAQLEAAEVALTEFDPTTARTSFERVLEIDSANSTAEKGVLKAEALAAIVTDLQSIKSLRTSGDNEAALAQINALIEKTPDNPLLLDKRKEVEADIVEDKREAILERADAAETEGDLIAAITALKEANEIRSDDETTERLNQLKAEEKQRRMEVLLETGYNALKAGNFDAAKTAYEESIALDPKSEEARAGLQKTSSLYLANIRYNQSIESSANYLIEGRIPLATKFFNEAIKSRPSNLTFKQKDEEARIRDSLAAQREPVSVTIVSNRKTYVSLIGVFPPERFKEKEIMLYPDVYTIRGTRSNHISVETEVKVSNSMGPEGIQIVCTDKL